MVLHVYELGEKASRFFVHSVDASLVQPLPLPFFKLFWTAKYPHFHCTVVPVPRSGVFTFSLPPSLNPKTTERKKKRKILKTSSHLTEKKKKKKNPSQMELAKPHLQTLGRGDARRISQRTVALLPRAWLSFFPYSRGYQRGVGAGKLERSHGGKSRPGGRPTPTLFLFTTITRLASVVSATGRKPPSASSGVYFFPPSFRSSPSAFLKDR